MKKLISLALVLMMVLSMTTVVFAKNQTVLDENTTNKVPDNSGTITITGIHTDSNGNTDTVYKIYKLLHLESYDAGKNAYSYIVSTGWEDFFMTGAGKDYVTFNGNYVTWNAGSDADTVNKFAAAALQYAADEDMTPVLSSENTGEFNVTGTTGVFEGLPLGYYLVDSNVGVLCGLTTTNPHGLISAKNGAPTLEKKVQEDSAADSNTNSWFDKNTADIGQYVNFDVTINVHAGAQDYVFHDKMSDGLTFVQDNDHGVQKIIHHVNGTGDNTTLVEGTHYTVNVNPDATRDPEDKDGCTFEIVFKQDFCNTLKTNDKLYITYDAKLNDKAKVGNEGNPNEAWLEYGEGHKTTTSTTKTYTYGFEIVKTDESNNPIDGATFKVYTQKEGGEPLMIVKKQDGIYRLATMVLDNETNVNNLITVTNGFAQVVGFDNGTYYLEEVDPPAGYNKLTERKEFTISDSNLFATKVDGVYTAGTGVQIKNSTGAMLPTTGATGTMIFITFGFVVMIATGLLLVTKKRMSMIQE